MAYKQFTPDVLSSSEVQSYLMNQSVIVFANATARMAALTAPTEGMVTYLQDIDELEVYNGSSWLRTVITSDDDSITTSGTVKGAVLNAGATTVLGTVQVGDSTITNSDGNIVIGKRNSSGGNRHFKIGYDSSFNICIGDYGFNGTAGTWLAAIKMDYATPDSTILANSSGYVRHAYQPKFSAVRSSDLYYYNASSQTNPIVYNAVNYNTGSHYNTSTGLFTAPVSATYWFQAGTYQSGFVSQLWWVVNGSRERTFVLDTSANSNVAGCGLIYLNANDTIGVVSWSGSNTVTVYANFYHTYFRGGIVV